MTAPDRLCWRVVTRWCSIYSALAPPPARDRRRAEIASHVWESQVCGVSSRRVLGALVRGVPSDLVWAMTGLAGCAGRSMATPSPYVSLAALLVLIPAGLSALHPDRYMVGVSGAFAVLAVLSLACAALLAIRCKRHP